MAYKRVQKSFGQSSSPKKQSPIVPPLNEQQTQSDSPSSSQVNLSRIPGKEECDVVRRSLFEQWANAPQKRDSTNTSHQDWHPPFGQHFGGANKTEDRKIRMEPSEERYSLVVTAGELTLKLGSAVKARVKYSIEGGDIKLLDIENGKTLRANTPSVVMASLREPATKYLTDNKIQNGG